MNLIDLGWKAFFQDHYNRLKTEKNFPARVLTVLKDQFRILSEAGEFDVPVSGKLLHEGRSPGDFPAVGDWVVVDTDQDRKTLKITAILPRRTSFSRRASGSRKRKSGGAASEQVIAANIDTVFIVTGLDRDFSLRRLERYLTLVYDSGADPVILLNKSDICPDLEHKVAETDSVTLGVVPIHPLSALQSEGLAPLREYLQTGKTVALVGSSGVGKSTLINSLLGEKRQRVESVRERDGRGRHTTSTRELIFIEDGGLLMDTPGLRELQLWAEKSALDETFRDIDDLAGGCRFEDCEHDQEPDCAVQKALADGSLDFKRYESYRKLKKEIWYLELSKSKSSRQIEKAKWERILKSSDLTLKQMSRLSKNKNR